MTEEVRTFLALGANLEKPAGQLRKAVGRIKEKSGLRLIRASSFYLTDPVGPVSQPPFVNAAIEIRSKWSVRPLFDFLLSVEEALGRKRTLRWGPRIIDIDLLFFGDSIIESPALRVPHPRMHERRFVLQPLTELAPDYIHPSIGRSISTLLAAFGEGGPWVERIEGEKWDPLGTEGGQDARDR